MNPIPLHFLWHYNDVDRAFWAEHLEGWLTDDVEVFDAVCAGAPWRQGRRVAKKRPAGLKTVPAL